MADHWRARFPPPFPFDGRSFSPSEVLDVVLEWHDRRAAGWHQYDADPRRDLEKHISNRESLRLLKRACDEPYHLVRESGEDGWSERRDVHGGEPESIWL